MKDPLMTPPSTLSEKAEELIPLLNSLSVSDRIGLAYYLERSVEPDDEGDSDEEIREAWAAELMRRIAEIESGEDPGIPAEEVYRLARESLS
jgi:putative addiction module component (TIGR02574 family)